jgi:anion-transporting  ArsA/GET3 family ATPase
MAWPRSFTSAPWLHGRRLLFVTGKGGTGKTTMTSAMAVAMARQGKRVLLATGDSKERLSSLFGVAPLSTEIVQMTGRIYGVKLVPEAAIREYGAMILRSRLVRDAVFNRPIVRRFFAGVPGLNEWAMLGKACYHATELTSDGAPRFDTVLLDAPATGHALDMLRVPGVIVDVATRGPLRRDAERALEMLRDPGRTGVVVVTVPEELPAIETLELVGALRGELRLPVAALLVNCVVDSCFSERERTELLRLGAFDPKSRAHEIVDCAVRRAALERVQTDALRRLATVDAPQIRLPWLPRKAVDWAAIEELSSSFEAAPESDRVPARQPRPSVRSSVPPP